MSARTILVLYRFLDSCSTLLRPVRTGLPSDLTLRARYQELALAALQSALQNGYKDTIVLEADPDLDPLRDTSAFKRMINEFRGKGS